MQHAMCESWQAPLVNIDTGELTCTHKSSEQFAKSAGLLSATVIGYSLYALKTTPSTPYTSLWRRIIFSKRTVYSGRVFYSLTRAVAASHNLGNTNLSVRVRV